MIVVKTPEEIDRIGAAGAILARCLTLLRSKARAGVSTGELDAAAERFIRSQGGEPAFKGYRGFPGSICSSPNSMVVHGIPGAYRLRRGDVLSIDVGVVLDGWVADAAVTVPIGRVSPLAERLLATTRAALFEAMEQCRAGGHLGDVSAAVQTRVESDGFSVIRSLVGHGVGRSMHEDPQVPNHGHPGTGPELDRGHGPGDRADGERRRPPDPHGLGRLGDLLAGRVAGRPLRAHGGDHRRGAPHPHSLAPGRGAPRGLAGPPAGRSGARNGALPGRRKRVAECYVCRPFWRGAVSWVRAPFPFSN